MVLVNRYTNDQGDLFLKFFLIDSSENDRQWRTTNEANERYARTAIGTPFTLMLNKQDSKYQDYHPFVPDDKEHTVKEEIDFAFKYAIGQIVDVSKESEQYKGAGYAANGDGPWFATVKITDPQAKQEFSKPESRLIPPAVSPGIIHLSGPDKAISEYHIVHLASVPKGAYGPRAIKWASCNGDALACIPKLKSAATLENIHAEILSTAEASQFEGEQEEVFENPIIWSATLDDKTCGVCERLDGGIFNRDEAERHHPAHTHCRCELQKELTEADIKGASYISPKARRKRKTKGASYKERTNCCVLESLSSLHQKSGSSDITMSAVNNSSTPGPQTFGTGTIETTSPTNNQQQQQQSQKPTIRIRKQKQLSEEEKPEEGEPENNGQENSNSNPNPNQATVQSVQKELSDLRKSYESQATVWKQETMRREIQDAIPKALFTDQNGRRFRQKDWEKEVETRLQQGLPIETIREIYQLKLNMLEVPELKVSSRRASSISMKSASSQNIDEEEQERRMKLAELGKMIRGER